MQNKKPIIIIAVLCVIALALGYLSGLPKEGSGGEGGNGDPKEPEFLKQGLVAYYPFNGNAKDESGNGYEGTQKGGVTYVQDRFGKSSSACSFDGKDDYVHVDKPLELIDANDITASSWFRINTKGKLLGIQIQGAAWGGQSNSMHTGGYGIGWYAQGNAGSFQSTPDCPNCWAIKAKEDLGDGWVHVLGTWERDENKVSVTLYVNGRKIQRATSGLLMTGPGQLVQPAGSHIIMGASSWPGSYSDGVVDELRIYNRALTEKEVAALYEFEN